MRLSRIALVLGVILAATLMSTPAANAGGWAVTYLDPLPERVEPGRAYVIGFWVLQHGSHPYEGDLGETRLILDNGQGEQVEFRGVALREPAHYAAAVAVPREGTWRLTARQGLVFGTYEIGTLTVPGGLALNPLPEPRTGQAGSQPEWGTIRPLQVVPQGATLASDPGPTAAAQQLSTPTTRQGSWVLPALAVFGVAAAGLMLLLNRRRRARSSP
jgi:hypothetical protein